jgi:G protein-coupled receptor GPR1
MQVYKPIIDPHDPRYGLNPYSYYVNTIIAIFPIVLASLAFINPEGGYSNGGAICWLPIRPIWYRLALSWIPRYIIFAIISGLSVAVYAHVGHQFRSFRNAWSLHIKPASEKQHIHPVPPIPEPPIPEPERPRKVSFSEAPPIVLSSSVHQAQNAERRSSLPGAMALPATATKRTAIHRRHTTDIGCLAKTRSLFSAHAEKDQVAQDGNVLWEVAPEAPTPPADRRESMITNGTFSSSTSQKSTQTMPLLPSRKRLNDELINSSHQPPSRDLERGLTQSSAQDIVEARRQTMIKQMRMTFVYPIVYMAFWIIPFVLHCLQYTGKYANDAPTALAALSTLCIASMGFANGLCFIMREKPWLEIGFWPDWVLQKRHHETAEASTNFVGIASDPSVSPRASENAIGTHRSSRSSSCHSHAVQLSQLGTKTTEPRSPLSISHARPWSAKNRALERLTLERSDRRRQLQRNPQERDSIENPSTSVSRGTGVQNRTPGSEGGRNWWDDSEQSSTSESSDEEQQQEVKKAKNPWRSQPDI